MADAFNGFRIPTATQGGPARGQPCSQSPIGLIFAAWGSLHSPVTEGEGDRSTRPPNPSNSPRGLCCYFTVSISKIGNWNSKPCHKSRSSEERLQTHTGGIPKPSPLHSEGGPRIITSRGSLVEMQVHRLQARPNESGSTFNRTPQRMC